LIQTQTEDAVKNGKYINPGGVTVLLARKSIESSVRATRYYMSDHPWRKSYPDTAAAFPSRVFVVNGDCVEAGLILKEFGLNPAVLVMASRSHPGGGYKKGAGAQEENICRRSSLWMNLEDPEKVHSLFAAFLK